MEIENVQLLRRQVARHCVYGVDINGTAVQLARLALWIHAFVPGLLVVGSAYADDEAWVNLDSRVLRAAFANQANSTPKGTSRSPRVSYRSPPLARFVAAEATWIGIDGLARSTMPAFPRHVSSPIEGWDGPKPHRHHDYINIRDFPVFWQGLNVTVEVKAKAKELAVKKLAKALARRKGAR